MKAAYDHTLPDGLHLRQHATVAPAAAEPLGPDRKRCSERCTSLLQCRIARLVAYLWRSERSYTDNLTRSGTIVRKQCSASPQLVTSPKNPKFSSNSFGVQRATGNLQRSSYIGITQLLRSMRRYAHARTLHTLVATKLAHTVATRALPRFASRCHVRGQAHGCVASAFAARHRSRFVIRGESIRSNPYEYVQSHGNVWNGYQG